MNQHGIQEPRPTDATKILIVDDHTLLRQGLRRILESHLHADISEAGNGIDALEVFNTTQPDIAILDIGLPGMRGIELAQEIFRRSSHTKVIFLTMYKEPEYVYQALSIGVSGYVLKECIDMEMIAAIQSALQGKTYLTPMISSELVTMYSRAFVDDHEEAAFKSLSSREREILALVSEGKSNKEIAHILYISHRTVEHHRQHLMKKLCVSSVPELIKVAIKNRLITF